MDEAEADIGAAISKVYSSDDTGDKLFILVSVANKEYARLIKLCNDNGESPKELANAAVNMLFKMLCEYTENKGIPPEDANVLLSSGDAARKDNPAILKTKPKRAILFIVITAIIALALCFFIAFFYDNIKALAAQYLFPPGEITHSLDYSHLSTQGGTSIKEDTLGSVEADMIIVSQVSTTKEPPTKNPYEIPAAFENEVTKRETAPPNAEEIIELLPTMLGFQQQGRLPQPQPEGQPPLQAALPRGQAAQPKRRLHQLSLPFQKAGHSHFTTKGYGHGVGMSQRGALAYSAQGWTYDKILQHYYTGTTIATDMAVPDTVTFGGKVISTKEYLARTTRAENW
jgi:hypothetical protein